MGVFVIDNVGVVAKIFVGGLAEHDGVPVNSKIQFKTKLIQSAAGNECGVADGSPLVAEINVDLEVDQRI